MKVSRRILARSVVKMLSENPDSRQKIVSSLAAYIVETKQTHAAHLLMKDIAEEMQNLTGHVYAEVVSAKPLNQANLSAVRETISRMGAKSIEINEEVLPEILGGLLLRLPGRELDDTVKTKLTLLT